MVRLAIFVTADHTSVMRDTQRTSIRSTFVLARLTTEHRTTITRGQWKLEESLRIIQLHENGHGWASVVTYFPWRTKIALARHYNSSLRKPRNYASQNHDLKLPPMQYQDAARDETTLQGMKEQIYTQRIYRKY